MKKEEKNIVCPLTEELLTITECWLSGEVFEGFTPISELHDSIEYNQENAEICLNCPQHQE